MPGKGHSFHKHPDQEEVLYVVAGTIEQWLDREKRTLTAGDAVFIPANEIHASFNIGEGDAKLVVIFGPCVGEVGFVPVDVSNEPPWNGLRA
jgi:quercetin dioxygenase-like cupin family protein